MIVFMILRQTKHTYIHTYGFCKGEMCRWYKITVNDFFQALNLLKVALYVSVSNLEWMT